MNTAERLREATHALGLSTTPNASAGELLRCLAEVPPAGSSAYLVLAVLLNRIPRIGEVKDFVRDWRAFGFEPTIESVRRAARRHRRSTQPVRVVSGTVIDCTDTAASSFTTGIQRVAKESIARWLRDYGQELTLVKWSADGRRLLGLTAEECERVTGVRRGDTIRDEFIIPFRASLVLPEISVVQSRSDHLAAIARFAGGRAVAVGFDCIPVSTAETAGTGMPGAFSRYLSTLARFDAVAPISSAASTEYHGWRRMLSGAGLRGPDLVTIELPYESAGAPDPARVELLRSELGVGETPVVLAVGSREPRKNHLALLHAAELEWRSGRDFVVVLVGGNAWNTADFDALLEQLRRAGRRIITLSGVDDAMVWALYSLSRFTVFCSLNEGFGLPVAESLSIGTPVITSGYGSMRSIGEGHGALLVDPRRPEQIAAAMDSLLVGDGELDRLIAETASLPSRSWDDYADRLWSLTRAPLE